MAGVIRELKPNKNAFLTYRLVSMVFGFLVLSVISLVVARAFPKVMWLAPVFVVLAGVLAYSRYVAYTKETYLLDGRRIVRKSGGIFSDKEAELIVRNITNVQLTLPFLENKLFGTGNVRVESAGSSEAEIVLESIEEPLEVYNEIERLMKAQGFSLSRKKLIVTERPHPAGVFFEVLKNFWRGLIFLFFGWMWLTGAMNATSEFDLRYLPKIGVGWPIAVGVGFLIVVGLFVRGLFLFLDLHKRVYEVYSDVIVYREGFLSKHRVFIPIENLADTTVTQTLVDKIFGLYDVRISCQGGGQEIVFGNMMMGAELEKTLDGLIQKGAWKITAGEVKPQLIAHGAKATEGQAAAHRQGTSFDGEYRMSMLRALLPYLIVSPACLVFFPLLVVWVPAFVASVIRAQMTTYFVKKKSVEEKYDFLTGKHKEFTVEKITGMVVKENFIDWLTGTRSITFWSIGSTEDITFKHIVKSDSLVDEMLKKLGVGQGKLVYGISPAFGLSDFIAANAPGVVLGLLLAAGAIVFGTMYPIALLLLPALLGLAVLAFVYRRAYYERSRLDFHPNSLHFRRGLIFIEDYYTRYDDVKDIVTLKYILSSKGSIMFDIAGEHIVQQKGERQTVSSNSFRIRYVEGIAVKDDIIDWILIKRPDGRMINDFFGGAKKYLGDVGGEPLLSTHQALGNTLALYALLHIVLFPLILILPITLPFVVWSVRARTYRIEPYRAVSRSGIFYKKQISVVFRKIDRVNVTQGMLNKLFGNGTVTVNTAGSSKAELVVRNVKDYRKFYEMLKGAYEGR